MVTLQLCGSGRNDVVGIVKAFDGGLVTVSNIDVVGLADGESDVGFSSITRIECDRIYHRMRTFVHESRPIGS
jgi:hypothetical protein